MFMDSTSLIRISMSPTQLWVNCPYYKVHFISKCHFYKMLFKTSIWIKRGLDICMQICSWCLFEIAVPEKDNPSPPELISQACKVYQLNTTKLLYCKKSSWVLVCKIQKFDWIGLNNCNFCCTKYYSKIRSST